MSENLTELTNNILKCEECHLKESRTNVVPGIYGPKDGLCFVGEAPGYYEDQQGIPFVGKSGKLLDKMLEGINLSRQEVSILNIVKCRPTDDYGKNRTPTDKELHFCGQQWLNKQLEFLSPKMIITLGRIALRFFSTNVSVTKKAGRMLDTETEYPIFVTYHPAAVLRNYTPMETYISHFEKLRQILDGKTFESDFNGNEYQKKPKQKSEQKSLTDFL